MTDEEEEEVAFTWEEWDRLVGAGHPPTVAEMKALGWVPAPDREGK